MPMLCPPPPIFMMVAIMLLFMRTSDGHAVFYEFFDAEDLSKLLELSLNAFHLGV